MPLCSFMTTTLTWMPQPKYIVYKKNILYAYQSKSLYDIKLSFAFEFFYRKLGDCAVTK